jgi:hypothetical protein
VVVVRSPRVEATMALKADMTRKMAVAMAAIRATMYQLEPRRPRWRVRTVV